MSSFYQDMTALLDAGTASWSSLYDSAVKAISDPFKDQAKIERFIRDMVATKAMLVKWKPLTTSKDVGRYNRLASQYAGLRDNWIKGGGKAEEVGNPIVVILGIAVAVGAAAWAVAFWEYAGSLRDRVALELREAEMRDQASKEGRKLQESTLPPPPEPPSSGLSIPWWVWAAGAGAIGFFALKGKE